jgi:aminomethyltransferase
MPVQYQSALGEHLAVRQEAGLFDVSHMGRFEVKGRGALPLLQSVACNDAAGLACGQAHYSALLNEEGAFIDDILVYRLDEEEFLLCVNASNREKDLQWLLERGNDQATVCDRSGDTAQIAIQGPLCCAILQPLTDADLSQVKKYWFARSRVLGADGLVVRTGYTGEDGFELYLPASQVEEVWRRLVEVGTELGLRPAGLAARNTLRLEMRYSLYGNDIDDTTTAWEAGLGWIVKMDKGDFVGRAALKAQKAEGVRRKLAGFEVVDRGIVRDHCVVFVKGGVTGTVTSGGFSPSLEKSIGLTYLPTQWSEPGNELEVEVRGRRLRAVVVETPFFRRS